jgi:hypothetical protein
MPCRPVEWRLQDTNFKDSIQLDRRISPHGGEYPRGGISKTRVHGSCFSRIRVPPPFLYRFGVLAANGRERARDLIALKRVRCSWVQGALFPADLHSCECVLFQSQHWHAHSVDTQGCCHGPTARLCSTTSSGLYSIRPPSLLYLGSAVALGVLLVHGVSPWINFPPPPPPPSVV